MLFEKLPNQRAVIGPDRVTAWASSLAQTQEIIDWLMVREALINVGQVGKPAPQQQPCDDEAGRSLNGCHWRLLTFQLSEQTSSDVQPASVWSQNRHRSAGERGRGTLLKSYQGKHLFVSKLMVNVGHFWLTSSVH